MSEANQGINPQMIPQPFNLGNWMAAYQALQDQKTVESQQPKVEVVEETYEGGWKAEGKERPLNVLVCSRCQWIRKNEQMSEPERGEWCDYCLEGIILGSSPSVRGH